MQDYARHDPVSPRVLAQPEADLALALAKGRGRLRCVHPILPAADAGFIRTLHYYAPLGGYRCLAAERASPIQITEVCLRVKVFGGYHSGRVLELPETAMQNDYITLPLDLPAGLMFQAGRTAPELHVSRTTYQLMEGSNGKYLGVVTSPRFIRSVTVPPSSPSGITITL